MERHFSPDSYGGSAASCLTCSRPFPLIFLYYAEPYANISLSDSGAAAGGILSIHEIDGNTEKADAGGEISERGKYGQIPLRHPAFFFEL